MRSKDGLLKRVGSIPKLLQRQGFPDVQVERLRARLGEFLEGTDLSECALIIDGPGLGIGSHLVALSLLGPQRVREFQSVHSVSASSYGVLYTIAWHLDMLSLSRAKIESFTRDMKKRHNLAGWARGCHLMLQKLIGSSHVFDNDITEEALAYGVNPAFLQVPVSELPENVSFWAYCLEDGELCEIRRDSPSSNWSVGDVIRCVPAVNKLYAPLRKEGKTYVDAVTSPNLGSLYRELRNRYRQVLFFHTNRDGTQGNTTFLKMHDTGSGKLRILFDFILFMAGRENREMDDAIRTALLLDNPICRSIVRRAEDPGTKKSD